MTLKIDNQTKIDIAVRKAEITYVSFKFDKDYYSGEAKMPEIGMSVDLLTASGNKIGDVGLSTDAYNKNTKLPKTEIALEIYEAIGKIVGNLKPVAVRKLNGIEKLIAN